MKKTPMEQFMIAFGRIFRERRLELRKTLKDVAENIKTDGKNTMAPGYLARIETGQKMPSLEVAEQMVKELNLDFKPFQDVIIVRKLGVVPDINKIQIHSRIVLLEGDAQKKAALARKKSELAKVEAELERKKAEVAKAEAELSRKKVDSSTNRLKKLSNVK